MGVREREPSQPPYHRDVPHVGCLPQRLLRMGQAFAVVARLTDAELTEKIRTAHTASKGTYGAPRIHADLAEDGIRVSRKRVARLMRAAGLAGVSRRKFVTTTVRDGGRQAPDLVERDFIAERQNMLWVADITYIPTWAGSSTSPSRSMSSAAGSWAGRWPPRCTPSSCSMP